MATIFETTGDEREQRIAELKQKMQESAKRKQEQAAAAEQEESTTPVTTDTAVTAEATETAESPVAAEVTAPQAEAADNVPVAASSPVAAAPAAVVAAPAEVVEVEEVDDGQAALTRREFLTYAWGAALGLLTVETALVSYFFMYPRFRAGEFGGKFFLPPTDIPSTDAAPVPETAGKFWLVNIEEEGPKALYMVCTHLGCLYKWQASNNRFECPCHGSKFSKAGYYIEGPAPRSLDTFELAEENGQIVVDTGAKITGNPSSESPARAIVA